MAVATRSIAPWLTHRRMVPKWLSAVATWSLAAAAPHPASWIAAGLGFLLFFPTEYAVHRGVFHHFAGTRTGRVVSLQHVRHHERPDELDVLFNHPPISLGVGAVYFLTAWVATGHLGLAGAFSGGNFTGLLLYEWVHLNAHRPGSRPWTSLTRYLKRYHLWHHYKHERLWYGVTSPLFDHLFGSYRAHQDVEPSPTVRTLVPPDEHRDWLR